MYTTVLIKWQVYFYCYPNVFLLLLLLLVCYSCCCTVAISISTTVTTTTATTATSTTFIPKCITPHHSTSVITKVLQHSCRMLYCILPHCAVLVAKCFTMHSTVNYCIAPVWYSPRCFFVYHAPHTPRWCVLQLLLNSVGGLWISLIVGTYWVHANVWCMPVHPSTCWANCCCIVMHPSPSGYIVPATPVVL